jgi:mRNA-degrading endonuclease RelE of RelBE toxin-antitoxin system
MSCKVYTIEPFDKSLKRLVKKYPSLKGDFLALVEEIRENPRMGTPIKYGLRKVRLSITSKGKGKSGGARVITLPVVYSVNESEVTLLQIYDKSECENIADKDLRALVEQIGI